MNLTIDPVRADFVAIARGIDIRETMSIEEVRAIHDAMDRFAVLIFHDQPLRNDRQVAFSVQLGPLQPAVGNNVTPQHERRLDANFSDVSNLDGQNRIQGRDDRARLFGFGNRLWHSAASYRAVPAKYSILSAHALPQTGGNTEFADMRAAYDTLDEKSQRMLEGLIAEHS